MDEDPRRRLNWIVSHPFKAVAGQTSGRALMPPGTASIGVNLG
jgi:hypothetical protein